MKEEATLIERTAQQMLEAGMSWSEGARELRKAMIAALLREHKGNVCRVARALRIHRNTLSRQIEELRIADVARQARANLRNQRLINFGGKLSARSTQRPRLLDQSRIDQSRVA